ncbi:MAG: hypothetical protein U0T77_01350 [Chitinophagales bacterium]
MKTIKTIRSSVAMMVMLFAVTATSCQKESINPAQPELVNRKPKSIITTNDQGVTVGREDFIYRNDTLVAYLNDKTLRDSILVLPNSSSKALEAYSMFSSRVFKCELFLGADKQIAQSSESAFSTRLRDVITNNSMIKSIVDEDSRGFSLTDVVYDGNNISSFIYKGDTVRITYYDTLSYQKGINALPIGFFGIEHFRLLELNDRTNTKLYSKLIKSVTRKSAATRNHIDSNSYSYVMDAHNRVISVTDISTWGTIGFPLNVSKRIKTIHYE